MRRKVKAKRRHICEICGKVIRSGDPCYRVDDDFMPGLVSYEHVCCDRQLARATKMNRKRAAMEADELSKRGDR